MQHCGKCSNYNSDDSIFCSHCGNKLNNKCPSCGFPNLPQQQFCGNCNKQLAQADETLPPSEAAPSRMPHVSAGPVVAPASNLQAAAAQAVAEKPVATQAPHPEAGEARFDSYPQLESYALLSLEFAHWDQVAAQAQEPGSLEQFRRQCLTWIEEQVVAAHGHIHASKNNVLFVSFKRESSLDASLRKAIEFSLDLLGQPLRFEEALVKLRIGLDIEHAQAKNPLTSTLERSVGLPGTLTVSEAVYAQMRQYYPCEIVGPVPMGNQMMQFYRILRDNVTLPDLTEPSPSVVSFAPPPSPARPVSPEPVAVAASAQPPVSAHALSDEGPVEGEVSDVSRGTDVEPTPETPKESATETESEPVEEAPPPPLTPYEPPVLGLKKTMRHTNLSYEQAIEALTSELSGFVAQGAHTRGKVLALCASDGLGKSNIVNMARGKVDPQNQRAVWMGGHNYRCFHRNQLPLYYWLELAQNLLSLMFEGQVGREVKDQISKFLTFVHDGEVPPEEMAFLSDFLSVQPPQPLTMESRECLGRVETFFFEFFRTVAAKRPLIVVVEDLQFADTASLELFSRLLEKNILAHPIYFVLTQTRDFYAGGSLAALLQKVPYKELVVSELDDVQAERFLDDGPLGGHLSEFPVPLIDSLLQHAKGVPLYMEEALRYLHLEEIVTVDSQTHKFVMQKEYNPAEALLPDSLSELLRRRMSFLSEKTLYVLRMAAMLGEKFAVSVLAALSQLEEEEFNQSLTTLFNHGYLVPDAVNTGRFRHGLIWQAVYEDMEESFRLERHQLISEVLENDFKQNLTVNPILIAYHAENGNLPNRALNYWNLAGIYAGQVGSLVGMNMAMFHALELLRATSPEPLHTQEMALRMIENLGIFNLDANPEFSIEMLEWVLYYRQREGDFTHLIEPLGFLASAYENKGDYPKALATLEKAMGLVDAKKYPLEYGALAGSKLEHLFTLGRYQQARQLVDDVIEPIARSQGYERGDANFFDVYLQACLIKAQVMLAQCDNGAAQVIETTLRHARERGLEGLTIALQLVQGQFFLRNGQYEICNREADSLLSAIEAMPDSEWFLAQWGLLAIMYHCDLEDWESAGQLVLTVVQKSEEARDYLTWVTAQTYAGYISAQTGKTKEARQVLEQAIQLSSDHRFASSALLGWRLLADFELSRGGKEVAYEIAAKALDISVKPEICNTYETIQLTLVAARALMAQGNVKAAGKLLEPVWPQVVRSRMQPMIAACAYEIGQLYKSLAHDAPADLSKKHLMRSVEFFLKAKGIWLELRHMSHVKKVDATIPKL